MITIASGSAATLLATRSTAIAVVVWSTVSFALLMAGVLYLSLCLDVVENDLFVCLCFHSFHVANKIGNVCGVNLLIGLVKTQLPQQQLSVEKRGFEFVVGKAQSIAW